MNVKSKCILLLVLVLLHTLPGNANSNNECVPDLEFRAGAFFPESKLYREIYGNLPTVQLETSYPLICNVKAWSNITFIFKDGHSIPLKNKTSILIVPFSLGLKYVAHCCHDFDLCIGAGATFSCVRIRDHSPYVIPKTQRYDFGGIVKFQIIKRFNCFYVSAFTDYFIEDLHIGKSHKCVYRHSQDIGGLFVGASIGKEF